MIFLLRSHAGLMILALCIMLTGAIIASFMKKQAWWLKIHRSLGITGVILFLIAVAAIAMHITLTERAHFRIPTPGSDSLPLYAVLTPTLGFLQFKVKNVAAKLGVSTGGQEGSPYA